jgi:hypothetical protein
MIVPRDETTTTGKADGCGKIIRVAMRFQTLWRKISGVNRRYDDITPPAIKL